jgi:type IV fimbrial biogenesis protein FimT
VGCIENLLDLPTESLASSKVGVTDMVRMEKKNTREKRPAAGFSMLEVALVMAIALLMAALAIPTARSAIASYQLAAAVDSVTGAIQGARYQAIMHGYLYQVDVNSTTNQIQISSEIPPATTFTATAGPVPVSSNPVTVGVGTPGTGFAGHATLQFKANGAVVVASGQAAPMVLTITYNNSTKTITVSNYASIKVQ